MTESPFDKAFPFKKALDKATDGKEFIVKFIKKDGSTRIMKCKFRIEKDIIGKREPDAALHSGLLTVWDVEKAAYRSININTMYEIQIGNVTLVKQGDDWLWA